MSSLASREMHGIICRLVLPACVERMLSKHSGNEYFSSPRLAVSCPRQLPFLALLDPGSICCMMVPLRQPMVTVEM